MSASAPASDHPVPQPKAHAVAIVGGGLVGASLAIALDRIGLDVALIEAQPPGAPPAVFDQRNLSLAEASVHALAALDVLPRLRAPTGAIARIHISRNGDFGRVLLDAVDYGRTAFGQVVVARDFGEALEAKLNTLSRLTRYRHARFIAVSDPADGVRTLRLSGGQFSGDQGELAIRARLVVGADGTASGVRTALGIGADTHDYEQTLFVARLRAERAPDGTAYERLTDHGPTALLPRGDGYYGAIHGVAREEADAVAALGDAEYLDRLQNAFGWRIGRFREIGPRSVYPITRVLARDVTAARVVLVGNAAQTLHPIGAQGFNLGLRDALTLAECIAAQREIVGIDSAGTNNVDIDDPGADVVLRRYVQRRREDRERTIGFSDGLARASANSAALMRPLRSLGLMAMEHDDTLRAQVVAGAMGYRGDVPALCRGVVA
jgi:2-octaprenyl-6-methoxyphenol hydroxylase